MDDLHVKYKKDTALFFLEKKMKKKNMKLGVAVMVCVAEYVFIVLSHTILPPIFLYFQMRILERILMATIFFICAIYFYLGSNKYKKCQTLSISYSATYTYNYTIYNNIHI